MNKDDAASDVTHIMHMKPYVTPGGRLVLGRRTVDMPAARRFSPSCASRRDLSRPHTNYPVRSMHLHDP